MFNNQQKCVCKRVTLEPSVYLGAKYKSVKITKEEYKKFLYTDYYRVLEGTGTNVYNKCSI